MIPGPIAGIGPDFRQIFENIPHPYLVLRPDDCWTILAVNDRYLATIGVQRADLLGRGLFDVFPDASPARHGTCSGELRRSLEQVRRDRLPDIMRRQKFDMPRGAADGVEVRYCRPVNTPILERDGSISLVVHHVEDVTEYALAPAESAVRKNETNYQSLFAHMREGFAYCRMLYDGGRPHDFIYIEVNAAFERLTRLTGVCGKKVSEVIPGIYESNPELFDVYGRVAACGNPERLETYVAALDIWFSLSVYSTEKEHFVVVFDNITERKKAEAELNLAACVFNNTAQGVVVTDTTARIVAVNPAFTEITGYSADEAIGNKPSLMRSDHHGPEFYRELWSTLLRDGFWQGELWNRRKSGEVFLERLTISSAAGPDGKVERYLGVFSDVTEVRRKDEHILHLAFHDPLTDLPNRALLLNRLEHGIIVAQREKAQLGVMFIDLDRFKAINDSLGHDVGDSLLREVARRLKSLLRASDTVARIGGDEFVVLLERADGPESHAMLAKRILGALAEPVVVGGHTMLVNASIGISCFPDDGPDANELMKNADAAMYAAKSSGRGTYRFFQAEMMKKVMQRHKLEMELRTAMQRGELELYYQPQLSFATNAPCGVEALVRWHHPVLGLTAPSEFIPLAEETGLICELGDWVLEQACLQSRQWLQRVGRVRIAVNLSAKQLARGDLVERIQDLTRQNGVAPSDLEIELTESAVMANPEDYARALQRLRDIGVRVAIDDFGTGYSSIACLRRLPIDVLKIDRSFVMNAENDPDDAQIVGTIIALAQSLKLGVVAEGVETESQADFLMSCGCTVGQGYLFARPAPATQIEAWYQGRCSA